MEIDEEVIPITDVLGNSAFESTPFSLENIKVTSPVYGKALLYPEDAAFVSSIVGHWVYAFTLSFSIDDHMFSFRFYTSKVFRQQHILMGEISNKKDGKKSLLKAHGDCDERYSELRTSSLVNIEGTNIYYRLDMKHPFYPPEERRETQTDEKESRYYARNFRPANVYIFLSLLTSSYGDVPISPLPVSFSSQKKPSQRSVNYFDDCSQQPLMFNIAENRCSVIPTPLHFNVTPVGDHLDLTITLSASNWATIDEFTVIVMFIFSPLFNIFSTDSALRMISTTSGIYHHYHHFVMEDPAFLLRKKNITVTKNIKNYFYDRPVSIIATVHNKEYLDHYGMTKSMEQCRIMHQYLVNYPKVVPRYIFLSSMPSIIMEVHQLSPIDFIIRFDTHDKQPKMPFLGNLTLETERALTTITDFHVTENTGVLLYRFPHEAIKKDANSIQIYLTCVLSFKKCQLWQKNHFIIIPKPSEYKIECSFTIDLRPVREYYNKRDRPCACCNTPIPRDTANYKSLYIVEHKLSDTNRLYDIIHEECHEQYAKGKKINVFQSSDPAHHRRHLLLFYPLLKSSRS